jgi:hypothetical protein
MSKLLVIVLWVGLVLSARADMLGSKGASCFDNLSHNVKAGKTLTVYTTNNAVVIGSYSNISAANFYMKKIDERGAPANISIPLEQIDKITYSKRFEGWWLVSLAGAAVGAGVGLALSQDSHSLVGLDDDTLTRTMIFGAAGLACGTIVGLKIHVTATVRCR